MSINLNSHILHACIHPLSKLVLYTYRVSGTMQGARDTNENKSTSLGPREAQPVGETDGQTDRDHLVSWGCDRAVEVQRHTRVTPEWAMCTCCSGAAASGTGRQVSASQQRVGLDSERRRVLKQTPGPLWRLSGKESACQSRGSEEQPSPCATATEPVPSAWELQLQSSCQNYCSPVPRA